MATEGLGTYSWDNGGGIAASAAFGLDEVSVSGIRASSGTWGVGSVNYQAGATTERRLTSSGQLSFDLLATAADGSYGSGSGYKSYVQFWNDPNNLIAIGLIHDPGPSPSGYTVMVEGAANGAPIGGYWGSNMPRINGSAHHFDISWTQSQIVVVIDGLQQYQLAYGNSIDLSNPSISFLSAARNQGDSVAAKFDNINFSGVGLPAASVDASATPRAYIEGTVDLAGSGVGYASYFNLHDANGNAAAFGFQADTNDRSSAGVPMLHYNVAESGAFTQHRYYDMQAPQSSARWKLAYYEGQNGAKGTVAFFVNNTAVASARINFSGRIFFQTEVNAAQNGNTVQSNFQNVTVGGTWSNGQAVAPNGTWNSSSFDFWGLDARQTNAVVQGANFTLGGTLSGLPAGADWDNIESINGGQYAGRPAGAIAMIAEWWYGQ